VGKSPVLVASTSSATEESCGQNVVVEPAVVELVETPAVGKSPMMVASTGSATGGTANLKATGQNY